MKKLTGMILITLMLLTGIALAPRFAGLSECAVYAAESETIEVTDLDPEDGSPASERLVVRVMDDETLLEDSKVPLASGPASEMLCATHALLALLFVLLTFGYITYFDRFNKRLYGLKEEAAVLEQRFREEERDVL